MKEIFNSYKLVLAELKNILHEDICVALTDTTRILKNYSADSFSVPGNEGDMIKEGSPIWETISKNKGTCKIVPKEYYGICFKSTTNPIRNSEGQVIGCIALARNLTEHNKIEESSENLFAEIQQAGASIQELNSGSEKLVSIMNNIVQAVKQTEKSVQEN